MMEEKGTMGKMKEGQRGKANTCMRETEGRENDMKGREDLDDRNRHYVHYNGDRGRGRETWRQ